MAKIKTCYDWIGALSAVSPAVTAMQLQTQMKNGKLATDALNLANCEEHTELIVRAIENLVNSGASSQDEVKFLLKNVIVRNTYGSFSELAMYDWLMGNKLKITTQISKSPPLILGEKEVKLDGVIDAEGIYFDIKAFGLHGRLAQQLKKCLEERIPGKRVWVEGSWDISVEQFSELIRKAADIAVELQKNGFKKIGRLSIRLEMPKPFNISGRIFQPYLLAKENALFPFCDANQFTNDAPFVLMVASHPWFDQGALSNGFPDSSHAFTRALARRAFLQFANDPRSLTEICPKVESKWHLADAVKLLSAIFFINIWPSAHQKPSYLYLNPLATHPLGYRVDLFRALDPHILVDDFGDDNY